MNSPLPPPRTLTRRTLGRGLFTASIALMFQGLALAVTRLASAASWEKIDGAHGITVHRRQNPGSPLYEFKGEAVVDAPMEKIIWVLADNEHRTEWVDRLKKSTVLERTSEYDFVLYQHFGAPAVVSDRDFVYRARASSRKDGAAVLEIRSITHPKAPDTVGVRGHLHFSSYVLKRVGEKTHVEVTVSLDPKGSLPGWIVNLVQKSWPMNTLVALRKQVAKPFVGTLSPPPIE